MIGKIKDILSKSFSHKVPSFGFIVGTGRCGTTILAQMLNSHSKICIPHELQILFEYSNNGTRLYEIFEQKLNLKYTANDYIEFIKHRCPYNIDNFYDYKAFFRKQIYPIVDLKYLATSLYTDILTTHKKEIFIEQTPWYGQRIEILNNLFPNAKYIHIIRDGRDVSLSFARTPWWHNDIYQNIERWAHEVNKIINDSNSILKKQQYLQIKYEDLVSEPTKYLNEICYFLNISIENSMLNSKNFVDYFADLNKKYGNSIFSSQYNLWKNRKNTALFSENVFNWKKNTYSWNNISSNAKNTLLQTGYDLE